MNFRHLREDEDEKRVFRDKYLVSWEMERCTDKNSFFQAKPTKDR